MDEIRVSLDSLLAHLRAHNVSVLEGFMDKEGDLPKITINTIPVSAACKSFGDAAVALGAKCVVADFRPLEEQELLDAIQCAEEAEEADNDARKRVLSMLRECRGRIGHIGSFDLLFLVPSPSAIVSLAYYAPWYDAVYGTEDELSGIDDNDECDDHEGLSAEEITEHAKKLAANPLFQKADKNQTRLFVAHKVFGNQVSEWGLQLRNVVDEALGIYETEIKPAREEGIRNKAKQMLEAGGSRSAVARELGLTPHKLGKLLD